MQCALNGGHSFFACAGIAALPRAPLQGCNSYVHGRVGACLIAIFQ